MARSIRWWAKSPLGTLPQSRVDGSRAATTAARTAASAAEISASPRAPGSGGRQARRRGSAAARPPRLGCAVPARPRRREHQRVGPAECDRHRRDAGGEPVHVHAERRRASSSRASTARMSAVPTSAMRPEWRSSASCTSSGTSPGRRATGRVRDRRCPIGLPSMITSSEVNPSWCRASGRRAPPRGRRRRRGGRSRSRRPLRHRAAPLRGARCRRGRARESRSGAAGSARATRSEWHAVAAAADRPLG